MTNLDRRVAELRGWTWDYRNGWWDSPTTPGLVAGEDYSPSTDLFQAYQLWEEARPDGYYMNTVQSLLGVWTVGIRQGIVMGKTFEASSLADLPRAITQAWVEVMEGK